MQRIIIAEIIAKFTRSIRFPGRQRLLFWLFPPQKYWLKGSSDFWFEEYDGDLKILCNLGSWIEWNIFFRGYYQIDLGQVMKRLVKPGMTIFDVGANVGVFTLLMAKYTGPTGKVYSFEPNPEVLARLKENIWANGLGDRVFALDIGLSDLPGDGYLFLPKQTCHNRGIASLYQNCDQLNEERLRIKLSTLDDFVADYEIPKVDFIKVDTEGNDLKVLRGALKTIQRFSPIIIVEANPSASVKSNEKLESLYRVLTELDYQLFRVGYFGRLIPLNYKSCLPEEEIDIVCIRR